MNDRTDIEPERFDLEPVTVPAGGTLSSGALPLQGATMPKARTKTTDSDTGTDTDVETVSSDAGTDEAPYRSESAIVPPELPQRGPRQRSETKTAVTDRAPEEAGVIAEQVTPSPSERVMGLPDSPSAAETGTGH